MLKVGEQLKKALRYEQLLLGFYSELENKLGNSELGRECRAMSEITREQISRINRWLLCSR